MADMDAAQNDVEVVTIAVMGATGAGKSTFINLASDSKLPVSDGLQSCTSDVQVGAPFMLDGRMVTLLDTPGFDDTVKTEAEIVMLISDFLRVSYESGRKLHGVIFLHRISDNKMDGVARKNFRLFRKLCGDDTLPNVVIATNMWGTVQPGIGEKREKELSESDLFFRPAKRLGTEIFRHDNSVPSVQRIVRHVMGFTPKPLLIQRELVDERKMFAQSEVGQDLLEELQRRVAKHRDEIELLQNEMAEEEVSQDDIQEMREAQEEAHGHIQKIEDEVRKIKDEHWGSRRKNETDAAKLLHEMDERESKLADTDLQTVVDRQNKKHQKELSRLRHQMEELLAEKDAAHDEEVQHLNNILASVREQLAVTQDECRRIEEDAQVGLEVTQARHREEVDQLKSHTDELISSRDAKHQLEILDLTNTLDDLRHQLDESVNDRARIVDELHAELEEQEERYQDSLDKQKDEFQEEFQGQESRYLEELDRQAAQHTKELDDLRRGLEELLSAKEKRHQLEARELSERLEQVQGELEETVRAKAQAAEDAEQELVRRTTEWRQELEGLRSELERVVATKEDEIQKLAVSLAETKSHLAVVESEKTRLQEESQEELERRSAAHQQELRARQAAHSEEVEHLKNSLAVEKSKHEADIQQVITALEEAKTRLEKSEGESRKAAEEREAEKQAHEEKMQEAQATLSDNETTIELLEKRVAQQETRLKELETALEAAKRSSGESQRTKVDVEPSIKDGVSTNEPGKPSTPRPKPTRGFTSYLWRR